MSCCLVITASKSIPVAAEIIEKTEGISIPTKDLTQVRHSMSSGQVNLAVWIFMVILPAAALLSGLVVWLKRRHR